jgi:hypothetical protein
VTGESNLYQINMQFSCITSLVYRNWRRRKKK